MDLGGLGMEETALALSMDMPGPADPYPYKEPNPDESAYITKWINTIDDDIKHHDPAFKKMIRSIHLAKGLHWPGQTEEDERYTANITRSVIRHRVSALYAKNPTVVAKRKDRMDFVYWDEDPESLQAALQNPQDPFNARLIQDVMQGTARRNMIKKVGRTTEILIKHILAEQQPNFKRQMKRTVRRVDTTGVGYVKLDFQRDVEVKPDIESRISDFSSRLSEVEYLIKEEMAADGFDARAESEKLKNAIEGLEKQKYILKKEGMVFRFPGALNIIPGKHTTQLDGWVGSGHVTEWFSLPADQIKRIYGHDVTKGGGGMQPDHFKNWTLIPNTTDKNQVGKSVGNHDVFVVHDQDTGMQFTICRGYNCYLRPPAPEVILTEQFYPIYALTFNEQEDDAGIFPPGTPMLMVHQQKEFNRSKEGWRQHRIALKPLYASASGSLTPEDKKNFAEHPAHHCLELDNMQENQNVGDKVQMVKKHPIDPNVYETSSVMADVQKVVDVQPANLSTIAGGTATETAVAQDSHQSNLASDADDQDDFLSTIMRDVGHNCLLLYSPETVKKIVGPGAVWPDIPTEDIIADIYIDIEAGSSGRPNRAAEASNLQRLAPFIVQSPGFRPQWWAKKLGKAVDENIDMTDMYLEGLPSMLAMNQAAQVSTGVPATDPAQQGGAGAMNAPGQVKPEVPAQPGMPGIGGMDASPQRQGGMLAQLRGKIFR